jgi:hypothetical protein
MNKSQSIMPVGGSASRGQKEQEGLVLFVKLLLSSQYLISVHP